MEVAIGWMDWIDQINMDCRGIKSRGDDRIVVGKVLKVLQTTKVGIAGIGRGQRNAHNQRDYKM